MIFFFFCNLSPKATKRRISKWDLSKLFLKNAQRKNLLTKKKKRQPTELEKIFENVITDKRLIFKLYMCMQAIQLIIKKQMPS